MLLFNVAASMGTRGSVASRLAPDTCPINDAPEATVRAADVAIDKETSLRRHLRVTGDSIAVFFICICIGGAGDMKI